MCSLNHNNTATHDKSSSDECSLRSESACRLLSSAPTIAILVLLVLKADTHFTNARTATYYSNVCDKHKLCTVGFDAVISHTTVRLVTTTPLSLALVCDIKFVHICLVTCDVLMIVRNENDVES